MSMLPFNSLLRLFMVSNEERIKLNINVLQFSLETPQNREKVKDIARIIATFNSLLRLSK